MEDKFFRTENANDRVVRLGLHKEKINRIRRKKYAVRVQVEVTSGEPWREAVERGLAEELAKLDGVLVVDSRPDWVFSIIALHVGHLVEISVILRQFFRATKPGTEQDTSGSIGENKLKPGAWVYESLKFHGLYGVPATDLKGLLASLAVEFGKNHLGLSPQRQNRRLAERQPCPRTWPHN